jgi:hypothetical protein
MAGVLILGHFNFLQVPRQEQGCKVVQRHRGWGEQDWAQHLGAEKLFVEQRQARQARAAAVPPTRHGERGPGIVYVSLSKAH